MKVYRYTSEQVAEIATYLSETTNTTLQRKYQVLQLSAQGHTHLEIGKMVSLHPTTVGKYVATYHKSGMAALTPVKQSGRPPFMTTEQGRPCIRSFVIRCLMTLAFLAVIIGRPNWWPNG